MEPLRKNLSSAGWKSRAVTKSVCLHKQSQGSLETNFRLVGVSCEGIREACAAIIFCKGYAQGIKKRDTRDKRYGKVSILLIGRCPLTKSIEDDNFVNRFYLFKKKVREKTI